MNGARVTHVEPPAESEIDERLIPQAGLNVEVDSIEETLTWLHLWSDWVCGQIFDNRAQLREPQGQIPIRLASCEDSEGNGFELRQEP